VRLDRGRADPRGRDGTGKGDIQNFEILNVILFARCQRGSRR
jgi:hypothetical protein